MLQIHPPKLPTVPYMLDIGIFLGVLDLFHLLLPHMDNIVYHTVQQNLPHRRPIKDEFSCKYRCFF